MSNTRVLVIEDDAVIRTNLEIILVELGLEIAGMVDNAMDALVAYTVKKPHIVLCDVNLNGPVDGITCVKKLNEIKKCPVIFLTAHTDEAVFNKARAVAPMAFISKPIDRKLLERTVLLAIESSKEDIVFTTSSAPVEECVYTRVGNKLKKINVRDIEFVDVDGKYCALSVGQRKIHCKIALKELLEKLPKQKFIQINRNSVINMDYIEDIDMTNLMVKMPSGDISISRTYKEQLIQRINMI
jgi:DNA-binding LytR/AlgR family response regulator